MEKTLRDAFGKPYNVELLDREEVDGIVDDLTVGEIVQAGLNVHRDDYGKTTVYLNCETGEIEAYCLDSNDGLIRGDELVTLFEIGQYAVRDCVGGYGPDEIAEILRINYADGTTDEFREFIAMDYSIKEAYEKATGESWETFCEEEFLAQVEQENDLREYEEIRAGELDELYDDDDE